MVTDNSNWKKIAHRLQHLQQMAHWLKLDETAINKREEVDIQKHNFTVL
jgi:hypothetical protein